MTEIKNLNTVIAGGGEEGNSSNAKIIVIATIADLPT